MLVTFIISLFKFATDNDLNPSTIKSVDRFQNIRSKQDPLLGIRALACLNVFFGHWFINAFMPGIISLAYPYNYIVLTLFSCSPWGGVWIFFTLSGYLMGKGFVTRRHNLTRNGIKKFYTHRMRRILPIYFSVIFIVAILMSPQTLDFRNPLMVNEFLEYCLFDLNGLRGTNGVLWSLSTECQFYLLVPFLYLMIAFFFTSTKKLLFFVISLCVGFVSMRYWLLSEGYSWHPKVYMPFLTNIDCFLVGVTTSIIVNNYRKSEFYLKNGMRYGFISVIALQVLLTGWSYPAIVVLKWFNSFMSLAPAVIALGTGVCIFFFETAELKQRSHNPFWKISAFAGAITYCFYVWHWPIIFSIRKLFPPQITLLESVCILPFGFISTLLVAYIFYQFVEKFYDNNKLNINTIEDKTIAHASVLSN
ncbi:acyltransferase family protein [Legionella genomosp. 1]|uniref:acyltransferase family protein n=1 Tax=Legionella genomosp. 1 TaxID=1093625 RepID=UPI0013EF7FE9|nr:acyltransferase [Legionella genomosp. 1]